MNIPNVTLTILSDTIMMSSLDCQPNLSPVNGLILSRKGAAVGGDKSEQDTPS